MPKSSLFTLLFLILNVFSHSYIFSAAEKQDEDYECSMCLKSLLKPRNEHFIKDPRNAVIDLQCKPGVAHLFHV